MLNVFCVLKATGRDFSPLRYQFDANLLKLFKTTIKNQKNFLMFYNICQAEQDNAPKTKRDPRNGSLALMRFFRMFLTSE